MAARELGNVLGNPLGRAKTLSGGLDKAVVGDLLFAASAPDDKWQAAVGQKLFMDEYLDLFQAFGGVLPVTGSGKADMNIAGALPTLVNTRIAVYGDNADTINGLTIATWVKTSTTVTTVYFVTLKNGIVDSYSLTITQSTGSYQPMNLTFTPNGILMLSGHKAYTGYAYAFKLNTTTGRFENQTPSGVFITNGNSYANNFVDQAINRSYMNRAGLAGPTSFYYWNGSTFAYSDFTSLYYDGTAINSGLMAFSSDGLRAVVMDSYYVSGWNYQLFMQYRTSLTTTAWSSATLYNGSGVAYTAATWWAMYTNSYAAWFNSDGSKFYMVGRYSSGYVVDVYTLTSTSRYDFNHSFIINTTPTDFVDDKYLICPNGTLVFIYDLTTETLVTTLDVSTYFSGVSEARLSNNYNYLVCRGSIAAGSPYPSTNVIPIVNPLSSRLQFTVPDLSNFPTTIASQYSPKVPRTAFMKVKP